jgi:D-serine/D-alanine/glycine transporter
MVSRTNTPDPAAISTIKKPDFFLPKLKNITRGFVMKTTAPGLIEKPALQRTLNNRHIQLMAMGGAIGTGLFMGSGKIIALSGTSIILIYMIG